MRTQVELPVSTRKSGKHQARQMRLKGEIPGVVYGAKLKNVEVSCEERMLKRFLTREFENTIFTIKSQIKEVNDVPVLMKAIDLHPVTRRPVHFDLYTIDMNKTVRVSVELKFEGKAAGITDGGILQPLMRELEVECLPKDIPNSIVIDVSPLKIHDSLHISEIALPAGVKPVSHENLALVTVTFIAEEVVAAPVAAVAAEGAAAVAGAAGTGAAGEPEVIKKGKQEEGAAEGAADEKKADKKPESKKTEKK